MPKSKLPNPPTSTKKNIQGSIFLIIAVIFTALDFPKIALIPAIIGVVCFVIAASKESE